jgi:hypothetical protein
VVCGFLDSCPASTPIAFTVVAQRPV